MEQFCSCWYFWKGRNGIFGEGMMCLPCSTLFAIWCLTVCNKRLEAFEFHFYWKWVTFNREFIYDFRFWFVLNFRKSQIMQVNLNFSYWENYASECFIHKFRCFPLLQIIHWKFSNIKYRKWKISFYAIYIQKGISYIFIYIYLYVVNGKSMKRKKSLWF